MKTKRKCFNLRTDNPWASIGRLITTARSRIAEDALSRAVERGVRQIAILGAGLDTFALRNPHDARQIRIYEVDHPATQAWKRQRLAEAQIALPPWLILVRVDFERDDVGEKLVAAGFQQNSPAFFTWLGVVPYLTQDAIGRTLDYMASIQNSEVVFDYMEPPEAFSEEMRGLITKRTEQLKKIDERSVSRFEPAGIAAIFARTDFVPSKTSISRRSSPGSAAPFKDSRPDTLAFMLSTLSTKESLSKVQFLRPSKLISASAACQVYGRGSAVLIFVRSARLLRSPGTRCPQRDQLLTVHVKVH